MARQPKRICSHCRRVVRGTCACRERDYKREEDRRGTSTERGYGHDWVKFRKWFLGEHTLCNDCGRGANEVHHVRKIKHAPELRLTPSNCMALCTKCHAVRTARGE